MAINFLNNTSSTGSITITKPTTDPLLSLFNTSNGSGATIRFSDQTSQSQVGNITFYHSDGSSQGGGASWHFVSEPDTVLVVGSSSVNGRFVAKSAGSAGEVDYGFYDDVNTGMVRTSADNVSLVAGGVAGVGVGNTAVSLKYSGSTKLATTSAGITVTGGGTFSSSVTASGNSNSFGNTTIAALSATSGTFSASVTAAGNSNSFGTTTFSGTVYIPSKLEHTGDSDTYLNFSDNTITLSAGGSSTTFAGSGTATFAGTLVSNNSGGYFRIQNAAGNSTYPTYSFQDDADTGMLSASSDSLGFITGGATALTLDSAQDATFTRDVTAGSLSTAASRTISILTAAEHNSVLKFRESTNNYGFTQQYHGTGNYFELLRHNNSSSGNTVYRVARDSNNITFYGNILLSGTGRIQGVDTVSAGTDAANKSYVDTAVGSYLPLAGGTMTGDIVMQDELLNFYSGGSVTLPQFRGKRDNTDLNNRSWSTEGGWAYTTFDNGTSNQPSSGLHNANGLLTFNTHSGNYMAQIAMTTNTGRLWHRRRNGGGWLAWYQIYDTQDFSATNISNWNTAYNNMITAVAVTGTTTKTITLTQQDGGTVSNTFTAGVVQSVTTGNANTISIGGSTANPIVQASTAAVNLSSDNLATGAQIQTAINTALTGVLQFEGTWNANTNTPTLTSGSGTSGDYYIVSTAGSTNLDGITDWQIGDWAVFANTTWTKIDNSQVGNVTGAGSSGRVSYWNSNSNITSDADFTFNGADLNLGTQAGTTAARLVLYGTTANNGPSTIKTTNGNLHIDADDNHSIYLGYYTGAHVIVGNGNGAASGTQFNMDGDVYVGDQLSITTIANATTDTDKFLVSDGGEVKYRTGAQLRSDIGAGTGSGNVTTSGLTAGRVAFATSGTNIEDQGNFTYNNSTQVLDVNGLIQGAAVSSENTRVNTSQQFPVGHYTPGETIWEIDPTWSDAQLKDYFGNNNVSWSTNSIAQDAPGGYAIYISGGVSVGGVYNSGFPYIPIDNDGVYYMECYIKNVGENRHYMGSNEFNTGFGSVGGNPGSFGYWVMANTNPGTSWTKVKGYIGGFDSSQTGKFELAAKYWTPQALFNYTNTSGTRACYISGWKAVRVDAPGNRYFDDLVNIGLNSVPTTRLQVSSDGANGIDISKDTGATSQSGRLFFSTDTNTEGVALLNTNGTFVIRTGATPGATSGTTKLSIDSTGVMTMSGNIVLGSGGPSITKNAGGSSGNHAAIEVYSSGTADTGAAIAIQQQTSEGDTIIFADYEPHVEWGISAENGANEIHFTGGNSTGSLGSKTFYNNAGSSRTAYKKIILNLANGNAQIGGTLAVTGSTTITTINNATSDTDKFLVSDSGVVKYRTGAQVLSDIGAGTGNGNVTTGGFTSARIPFANSSVNLDNSADLAWDDSNKKLLIGQPTSQGASGTVVAIDGRMYIEDAGTNWNETTPGKSQGSLHFDPQPPTTNNIGNAITFGASDTGSGTTAHAGIYTRSDGSYGTKMYIATTDDYSAGSKTAITIQQSGAVAINRSHLTIGTITNASSDTDKFLVSNNNQVQYRTGAQVLSDIGGAPATGGAYLPLTGGTMTGQINARTVEFDGIVNDGSTGALIGRNYAYDTLELRGHGAELMIGSKSTDLHINFRACNNNATNNTPTNWYWRAGSSTSFSNHHFGIVKANSAIRTDSYQNSSGNILFLAGNTTTGASRSLNLRHSGSTGDPSSSDDSNSTGITWGQRSDSTPYYIIYPQIENYNSSGNYSKLTLAWHTGIKIGAASGYGGTRFYNNSPDVSGAGVILNVGVGSNNVGVEYDLNVNGQAKGPAPTTTTSYTNKTYVDNAISGVPQGTVTGSGQNLRLALWDGSSSIGSDGDFTYNGNTIFTTKLSVQNQINTTSANLEINFENGDGTTTNFKNFDIRNGKNSQITTFYGSSKNIANRGNNFLIGGDFGNNSYNSTTGARLLFGGGVADSLGNYYIGTNLEDFGGNYNKLDLRWHTGIRMGAQGVYGGVRIYDSEDLGTVLFSVGSGNGQTGVSVTNNLTVGGDITIGGRDLIFSNTGTNDANVTSSLGINFIVGSSLSGLEIDAFGGVTTYNVLTTGGSIIVGGGGIQLNGTGRIEGIDTITDPTDAANKAYVDARDGTVTSVATGGGLDGGAITTTGTIEVEYDGVPTNIIESGFDFTGDTVVPGDRIMISDPGATTTNRRIGYVNVGDLPFASSSVVSGVTSVATTNGISGGTITGTGTIQVDGTVIRNTGTQTITGNTSFAPSSTSTSYTHAAIELRESNQSGSSGTPPRISWHHGGVVASSMTIEANGSLAVRNNPGTAYEKFTCGNLYAKDGTFVLGTGGTGDLWIGNQATGKNFRFHTNNNQTYFDMNCSTINWREGSSTRYYFYPATANMTINGTLTQNSDARVKENVVEIDNCIGKVQAMKGVYYNRTDFNTDVTKVGVIAQDVEAVLPELILEAPDTKLKSVAYAELTAVLINAIKEQQEIIEDLKTRVQQLEK